MGGDSTAHGGPSSYGAGTAGHPGPQSTRLRSGALGFVACPARSTMQSTFYLALPAPTLMAGLPDLRWIIRTTLPFQAPADYGSSECVGYVLCAATAGRGCSAVPLASDVPKRQNVMCRSRRRARRRIPRVICPEFRAVAAGTVLAVADAGDSRSSSVHVCGLASHQGWRAR